MPRFRGRKDLHQFWNDRPSQRPARNDRGQLPPLRRIAVERGNNKRRNKVGHRDRNDRRDPHQRSQRRFEIHLVRVAVARLRDQIVDEIRQRAGHQHGDAHHENPYQQLNLQRGLDRRVRVFNSQQNERNQRDARNAVGFKAVRAGSD